MLCRIIEPHLIKFRLAPKIATEFALNNEWSGFSCFGMLIENPLNFSTDQPFYLLCYQKLEEILAVIYEIVSKPEEILDK